MAIESTSLGTFIPNAAGNPKILSLSPAEKAQFAAEKAREQVQKDTRQPVVQDSGAAAVPQGVSNLGENVDLDV